MKIPRLSFVAESGHAPAGARVIADLDALAEFGVFIEGTSRSGKTNVGRLFCEQTYGQIQHIVIDPEGQYPTLRSAERPYLIVGKGRDVDVPTINLAPDGHPEIIAIDEAALRKLAIAIVEHSVSVIFDLSDYDLEDQQVIVGAIADTLVALPEDQPRAIAVILEEMQDFGPEHGGKDTALPKIRRLAKRGLKRGVFMLGVSQRVADVSNGVITQLKNKIVGGTDFKDSKEALAQLGLPSRDAQLVTDLEQGQFWVKGPAFTRHAQLVQVPRAASAPAKRRRGDPPVPAAEAPAAIVALAAMLAKSAEPKTPVIEEGDPAPFVATRSQIADRRGFIKIADTPTVGPLRTIVAANRDHPEQRAAISAQMEETVTEAEAVALRAENEKLRRTVDELSREIEARKCFQAEVVSAEGSGSAPASFDEDALFERFKARLTKDAPRMLKLLTVVPELEVEVERKTLAVDGSSQKGRVVRLLKSGFFANPKRNQAVKAELERTGPNVHNSNLSRDLNALVDDGFLTREAEGFQEVAGMKINIVER